GPPLERVAVVGPGVDGGEERAAPVDEPRRRADERAEGRPASVEEREQRPEEPGLPDVDVLVPVDDRRRARAGPGAVHGVADGDEEAAAQAQSPGVHVTVGPFAEVGAVPATALERG